MQEGSRTQSYGRFAAFAAGQPRRCPVGLAALRFGKYPLADLQRFQSPLATEGHAGRFDWHMAPTARGAFSVVRTDSAGSSRICCAPRRRNKLASARQNVVALVLR